MISAFLQADLQLPTVTWSVEAVRDCDRCDSFKVLESSFRIEKPWHTTADCSADWQIYQCTCSKYHKRTSFRGLHMQFAHVCIHVSQTKVYVYVICSILLSTFTTFTTGASAAGGWCNCGKGGRGWCEATGAAVAGRQLRFSSHGLPLCQRQS